MMNALAQEQQKQMQNQLFQQPFNQPIYQRNPNENLINFDKQQFMQNNNHVNI